MANQKHVDILKRDVRTWNQWREKHANIKPDLSGADLSNPSLSNADLSGTDKILVIRATLGEAVLSEANLSEANLSGANLSGAFLFRANLSEANLSEANLSNARLYEAEFGQARLYNANLGKAYLYGAYFVNAFLFGAKLIGADLSNANLREANLRDADLSGANLEGAMLLEANLSNANLSRADLNYATLISADLSRANLSGANLSNASLNWATLHSANLSRANFRKARLGWTRIVHCDLSMVKGLETVEHDSPSSIGIDTIYQSRGDIPGVFLRGAGVPDSFIDYIRSLIGKPIDYYTCFISYSSKDQAFAERLYSDLQNRGVRCWFAPEDMKIGDKIRYRIDESIRLYDKLLLVLSEHSVQSQWVEQEVETALAKEREGIPHVLFPIRLDETVMQLAGGWPALIRNTRNIGDFTRWKRHDAYQKALDRLLRDLKAETSKPGE